MKLRSRVYALLTIFAGCAGVSAWLSNPATAQAAGYVINGVTAYLAGNAPAAVVDGLQAAPLLVRSIQGTSNAASPAAVKAAVVSGGGTPTLGSIAAVGVTKAVAAGAPPDQANELIAEALDAVIAAKVK